MTHYYEYSFKCDGFPTPMTLHAITTLFLDGVEHDGFKVTKQGRVVRLTTNVDLDAEFKTELNSGNKTITVNLFKKVKHELPTFEEGDKVAVSGLISAFVRDQNGKQRCPYYKGKFEVVGGKTLRDPLKLKMQSALGVEITSMNRGCFTRNPNEMLNEKIQINNQLAVTDLMCVVTDAEKFNSLAYRACFSRKSYGMGVMSIREANQLPQDLKEAV
ncbi:hypothetical protein [Neptuniibacter sp. QD37_11]|uniref:hypothetical protein n=1 Tax=Neptuniibacter sp. QD37_11 TaxID=3398209 RepID=UPI0039F633B9